MTNLYRSIIASLAVLWLLTIFISFTHNIDVAAMQFAVSGILTSLFALTASIVGLMRY